ncbi:hypothetical protein PRIPAC_84773 [Pristionchus pacificus]|uniref:F-box domain-containing protein n=1 Tax=Pristionchus pacificus TaxID=54126 RepID=A0A2A6BTI4_PRIPA|nr:hypothetical protein PRIPAC_84773 [Pristionchus pacificus]|eukprot:PDM69204.1 hypothetical protein PRIPAC_47506 [Pristionchus pacificus]
MKFKIFHSKTRLDGTCFGGAPSGSSNNLMEPPTKRQKRGKSNHTSCSICETLIEPQFSTPSDISDRDFLSNLPADCIRSIFSFLNHNNLDIVARVSQRMNEFSNISRSKVAKSSQYRVVKLSQDKPHNQLTIWLRDPSEAFNVPIFEKEHISESERLQSQQNEALSIRTVPHSTIVRLDSIMARFKIEDAHFEGINFGYSMVLHCLKWSQKPIKFRAANATFEEECVKEKFLSMLLAIEVNHVILRESVIANEIDNSFLKEFCKVSDPSIEVCDYADWKESGTESDLINMEQDTLEACSLFTILRIFHMRVNSDWVMPAIVKRFRRNITGTWNLSLTRELTYPEVKAVISDDLKYIHEVDFSGIRNITIMMKSEPRPKTSLVLFTISQEELQEWIPNVSSDIQSSKTPVRNVMSEPMLLFPCPILWYMNEPFQSNLYSVTRGINTPIVSSRVIDPSLV